MKESCLKMAKKANNSEAIVKTITDMGWDGLNMTKGGKFKFALKKYGTIPVFFGPTCAFVYDFNFHGETNVVHDWASFDDIKGAIRAKTLDIENPENLSGLIVIDRYDVVGEYHSEEDEEFFGFVGITDEARADIAARLEKMADTLYTLEDVQV